METLATVHYGCGIYIPDMKYIKPEYHPTISGAWVQALQKINPQILETCNIVNENYYAIESLYQTRLWAIDQNRNCSEIDGTYTGCILPFSRQPKLFDGLGHSYQGVLTALRNKYGKYLVDDFNYEDHFVQYEIVEF